MMRMLAKWCAPMKLVMALPMAVLATVTALAQSAPPTDTPQLRIEAGQHTATIRRMGLTRDQRYMATGSDDKTVRLWSMPDGALRRVLRLPIGQGNDGRIFAVAITPDGRTIAAGGWLNTHGDEWVYLLDANSGAILRRLGPLPNVVNELEFSPDGRHLVVGLAASKGIRVWETGNGRLKLEDTDYGDRVLGLNFASNGELTTSSYDGHLRLYDRNFKLKKKAKVKNDRPSGVAYSPDGRKVAIGYSDGIRVEVYSASTLAYEYSPDLKGISGGNLGSVTWSGDGQFLFASGTYGNGSSPILRWSLSGRGSRTELPGPRDTVFDLGPWGSDGVVYAASDPAFGILDRNGNAILKRGSVTADMRNKLRSSFVVSDDARRVRFGLKIGSGDPWLFNLDELSLKPSPQAPSDLNKANFSSMGIKNWEDETNPTLNGKAIPLRALERSRSIAILPGNDGFILGSEWALQRFDANAKSLWRHSQTGVAWGVNLSSDGRIIVAAYGDGTLRWHRASDGVELLAAFVHVPDDQTADRRWVIWTPKGYYTASTGAEALIGWQVNRGWDQSPDFFPAAQFRKQFYRPDIVRLVLETLDEEKAITRANVDSRRSRETENIKRRQPPVVTITSPRDGDRFAGQQARISYSVRSPSGLTIRRVWALVDGLEVATTKGLVPIAQNSGAETRGTLALELPPRDVTVAVLAETDQGVASVPAEIRLTYSGASQPGRSQQALVGKGGIGVGGNRIASKPRLYALVIGVASYKDRGIPALGYAAKDARDVAEVLRSQKAGLYEDVEIRLLTEKEATQKEILKGLGWIATAPAQSDVAIVFVSGHGVTDETGDYQFLPHDAEMDAQAPIWAPIEGTAVPHSSFARALKRAQRAHTFFMFDTCHAGDATGGGRRKGAPTYAKFVNELTSAETGVRVLASSEGREVSLEHSNWQNGAFTKAVVEALKGGADVYPKDGIVTADELSLYVKRRVQDLTRNRQHPVTQSPALVRDIPLTASK